MTTEVGTVRRWDTQSDWCEGQYKIVEHLGGNRYRVELLEPDEHTLVRMDEFLTDSEYLDRIDDIGTGFTIRLVSSAEYHKHF